MKLGLHTFQKKEEQCVGKMCAMIERDRSDSVILSTVFPQVVLVERTCGPCVVLCGPDQPLLLVPLHDGSLPLCFLDQLDPSKQARHLSPRSESHTHLIHWVSFTMALELSLWSLQTVGPRDPSQFVVCLLLNLGSRQLEISFEKLSQKLCAGYLEQKNHEEKMIL